MNKRRRMILKGAGLGALALTSWACFKGFENTPISTQPEASLKLEGRAGEIQKAGGKYLNEFLTEYISKISPHSSDIRDNIKWYNEHGKDGQGEVVQGYFRLYDACMRVAANHIERPVSQTELEKLANELTGIQKEMIKVTELNLNDPAVEKAYIFWGSTNTKTCSDIVRANMNTQTKDFGEMIRKTYTREEFKNRLEAQNEAEKVLFAGFLQSLKNRSIVHGLIGKVILDETQKKSWELNQKELDRFYPNKEHAEKSKGRAE